ncbi:ferredoxin--NADP reductase [Jongsikchunia kroppenstedtii]|uniref:ferredoxin--NADP reductase n=1 Tax=Jongsikchunia kroppenstedtii TaxID=1121721 RepID=UPI00035F0E23|nr:ferredoxin--NADP reductase [Jongsikchunia kroppenstedtii]
MRSHKITVHAVVAESADAVSVSFDVPPELTDRFRYLPGQFLTLRIPSTQTGSVARCYSLSSSPAIDPRPTVTVKRTADGYASNWLCDNLAAGTAVTVLEPSGTFVADSPARDVLLCAAGSGITPIMSITKSILHSGTGHVALLYANRDRESTIFLARLAELAEQFPGRLMLLHWWEEDKGLPTAEDIADIVRPYSGRDTYLCGPQGFMAVTTAGLGQLGVMPAHIRREEYRSLDSNPFDTASAPKAEPESHGQAADGQPRLVVDLDGETHELAWPRGTTLLQLLLDRGFDPPYVCRESACGTCVCSVKTGRTRMLMNESLIDDELEMGLTLACQTLPESDLLHIAFDQ